MPPGWTVRLEPEQLVLPPGEAKEVTIDVTAPDGFQGRQAINVNAFDGETLAGGVTLVASSDVL